MKENEQERDVLEVEPRPWWSVRVALIAVLVAAVSVLVALLARPDLLEHGITLAGL